MTTVERSPIRTSVVELFKERPEVERINNRKVIYSDAQKQSNSGWSSNTRFLLYNGITEYLGYYNEGINSKMIPFEKAQNIKQPKKKIHISKLTFSKPSEKPKCIQFEGQVESKDEKPVKAKWLFTFKNNRLTEAWIRQLNQVKRQYENTKNSQQKPIIIEKPQLKITKPEENIMTASKLKKINQNPQLPINKNDPPKEQPLKQSKIIQSKVSENTKQNSMLFSQQLPIQSTVEKKRQSNLMTNSNLNKGQPQKPISNVEPRKINSTVETTDKQDWNQIFYFAKDPLETILNFRKHCEEVIVNIIDDFSKPKSERKYLSKIEKQNYEVYEIDNQIYRLAFTHADNYDQRILKNEFKNYNYLIYCTKNKGVLRVPLSCLVEYKGILAFAKAKILDFEEITAESIVSELTQLEKLTKIRKQTFENQQNGVLKRVKIKTKEIIYVDNLVGFIPYDINASRQESQLRQQAVQVSQIHLPGGHMNPHKRSDRNINRLVADLDEISRTVKKDADEILYLFENMDLVLLNTIDLTTQLHLNGVNIRCIADMYRKCQVPLIKKYLISEMAARVCANFLRIRQQSEIQRLGSTKKKQSQEDDNKILLRQVIGYLNDVLSGHETAWKPIYLEVNKRYSIGFFKEELSIGFFLSAIFRKSNLILNYDHFIKEKDYLRLSSILKADFFEGFGVSTRSYDIRFSQFGQNLQNILNNSPNEEGKDYLISLLGDRRSTNSEILTIYNYDSRIRLYLANFIPIKFEGQSDEFKSLKLYQTTSNEPPTVNSIKLAIMAVKWAKKSKKQKQSLELFEKVVGLITFWGGEYHPLLSQFYDLFSAFKLNAGLDDEAIKIAKSSLVNTIKVVGTNNLLTAQKHYQLGNMFYKLEKKQEALIHFTKTRQILKANDKTDDKEYGVVNTKLCLLLLNYCKNSEAVLRGQQALNAFTNQPQDEIEVLQIYELLQRIYELQNQQHELLNLSSICSKRLNNTQDAQIMERMLKIGISPYLAELPQSLNRQLINLIQTFPLKKDSKRYEQAFDYLHKRAASQNIINAFVTKIKKFEKILNEISHKDLLNKHKGITTGGKTEGEEFLVLLEAIIYMASEDFILGILKEQDSSKL